MNRIHLNGRTPEDRHPSSLAIACLVALAFVVPSAALASAEPATTSSSSGWSLAASAMLQQIDQELIQQAEPPQGEIIEAILVDGNVGIEDDTVLFFLESRVGAAFNWETARRDYRSLLNSGFFDDIVMRWRPGTSGIVIEIEVRERPRLRRIRIEGSDSVSPDDLTERMELLEIPVTLDEPLDMQTMRQAEEVLKTMLQGEEGFQYVQVDLTIEDSMEGGGVDAVFNVIEGDQVAIAQVNFDGATVFTQRELRWKVKRTGEHWLGSMLTKNDRFSWAGFESDMYTLRQAYFSLGYLDFNWGEPEISVYDVDQGIFRGEAQQLFVTIPMSEGTQYTLGEIKFEGNEAIPDALLESLVPLSPGDVFNVELVLEAQKAMESIYMNRGYLQVLVAPAPSQNPDTGVADLTYRIWENDLYYVRRIDFEGNTNTRDYVIRRNLTLNETDRWSQGRFQQSLYKIYQLGYFDNIEPELSLVDPDTGEVKVFDLEENRNVVEPKLTEPDTEPGRGEVDVTLKLNEVGRNQISFGGGVSALDGAFVQFGYTTRNLFGRGQTVSFSGQFGGRRTNARISFMQPFLFNRPLRFGFDLFKDDLDYFDFQRKGTGISTRLGFALGRAEMTTAFFEYNYEFISVGDISSSLLFGRPISSLSPYYFGQGEYKTSSVRPYIISNTINNPFNASRGRRLLGSFEIAGGPLGGTLDYWKATGTATWYIPTVIRGQGVSANVSQIFAFNVEMRWAGTYGDLDTLPIFERFFLGGSNSIRGTRLRAVGPVDEFGNILGGDRALQYNIEYIFQIASPIRIAIFHDAGQAWAPDDGLDLEDLRKTAGVEFRVFMPMFNVPFRFFWAYNFDPRPEFGEEKSTFEFAIGSTF
jgi:outer membrane protein insertion porin family